jgi:SsrA-binding protein
MTLVALTLYFNEKGRAKLELALARGKKLHDKRESEKRRSWQRERGRLCGPRGDHALGPASSIAETWRGQSKSPG